MASSRSLLSPRYRLVAQDIVLLSQEKDYACARKRIEFFFITDYNLHIQSLVIMKSGRAMFRMT
jgi:hypothetical protein